MSHSPSHPRKAGVLSLVIPGLGQLYNGDVLRALLWFNVTAGVWIISGAWLAWIGHVISAITAYRRAGWR